MTVKTVTPTKACTTVFALSALAFEASSCFYDEVTSKPANNTASIMALEDKEECKQGCEILLIQTGGTIDKDYPKRSMGYAFEISESAAHKILTRIQPNVNYSLVTLCREDSQNVTLSHRKELADLCTKCSNKYILITHGTDTMIETGQFLSKYKLNKVVVLTGSFKPETFKDSDTEFNIGFALGSLLSIGQNGVYIAMNAELMEADHCYKDHKTGNFSRLR